MQSEGNSLWKYRAKLRNLQQLGVISEDPCVLRGFWKIPAFFVVSERFFT